MKESEESDDEILITENNDASVSDLFENISPNKLKSKLPALMKNNKII